MFSITVSAPAIKVVEYISIDIGLKVPFTYMVLSPNSFDSILKKSVRVPFDKPWKEIFEFGSWLVFVNEVDTCIDSKLSSSLFFK